MTVGVAGSHANGILNLYRSTTYTGVAAYLKLHIGDPGSAGTANSSAVTTRNAVTFNAASGGSMTLSAIDAFAMTASETITHVSFWTAATAGTFLQSGTLTASVPVINGTDLDFTTITLSYTPIAA